MPEPILLFLSPAAAVLLLLFYINLRVASPVLAIPIRWLRWILFALFAAQANAQLGWIDRPFWTVAAAVFLLWFLLESGFNWLKVSAISLSPMPLFPRYVVNTGGDEWPTQPRLLKVRDWLRDNRFTPVQALRPSWVAGSGSAPRCIRATTTRCGCTCFLCPRKTAPSRLASAWPRRPLPVAAT